MAKIGLPKGSGKRLKVREKSVKSQGILKWILSGNPVGDACNEHPQLTFSQRIERNCNLHIQGCGNKKVFSLSWDKYACFLSVRAPW